MHSIFGNKNSDFEQITNHLRDLTYQKRASIRYEEIVYGRIGKAECESVSRN